MMAAVVFQAARFGVGFIVRPSTGHAISLVELVQQYIAALGFFDIIVYPHLVLRHELINVAMTAFGEVYWVYLPAMGSFQSYFPICTYCDILLGMYTIENGSLICTEMPRCCIHRIVDWKEKEDNYVDKLSK